MALFMVVCLKNIYTFTTSLTEIDLHAGNILLKASFLDTMSVDELYKTYGRPEVAPIERIDGGSLGNEVPASAVGRIWMGVKWNSITPQDAIIQLSDFGEAFQPALETRTISNTPWLLMPPEVNFETTGLSFPSDIWTLACTLYEIFGQGTLFEGLFPDEDDILAENISAIGALPAEWDKKWSAKHEFFDDNGEWICEGKMRHWPRSRSLAERIDDMGRNNANGFSDAEKSDFLDMLSKMLVFRPEERITARGLIKTPWMKNWGIPTFEKHFGKTLLLHERTQGWDIMNS